MPGRLAAVARALVLLAACARAGATPAPEPPACSAGTLAACVQQCRERFAGPEQREQRLACFDALPAAAPEAAHAPAAPVAAVDAAAPTAASEEHARRRQESPLERLWDKPEGLGFLPYRQSYVMVSRTASPNSAPTSPNPLNQVPATTPLEHTEAKFAFSLKSPILPGHLLGEHNELWFGYSQESFWQAFDASHSRPFRESDYEPELIFSHRLRDTPAPAEGLQPVLLNLGLLHQSNGQSDPRSRSWNRAYAQVGFVERWSEEKSLAVLVRPWWRFPESGPNDNNPDIVHYMGHGDIECQYWHGNQLWTLMARVRAVQLDFATPLLILDRRNVEDQSLRLHLQFFSGYGESLIDYNQRHTTFGLGFSVPYGR